MPTVRCVRCAAPYPPEGVPYLCPECGGVFDFDGPFDFHPSQVDGDQQGLWRYRATFHLFDGAPVVSLGEGGTPLVPVTHQNEDFWLKLESLNPTGSYKDRGSAVLISQLAARGVREAVEDSSGNAGASFAAYAARAGMQARVYVPESASGPKRSQIELYGADLRRIPGPRSAAAEAVLAEARRGVAYASHAYLPFGLAGIATIAYELWQQVPGGRIGAVFAPAGHGGLLLGILRGFEALQRAGLVESLPYFVGVQAEACAPIARGFASGPGAMEQAEEGPTAAEGVRVRRPVRAEAILRFLTQDHPGSGEVLAVPEVEILPAFHQLARQGVHVEPTSALVWAATNRISRPISGPKILILSGAGLKYQPTS